MTKAIWKFPLELMDSLRISMPIGSKILTCQIQNGVPCLWVLVDPDVKREVRVVHIIGTGNRFPCGDGADGAEYVGTVQMAGGALVWHVFVEDGK